MELRILGSGGGAPSADRGCAGYLLRMLGKTFLLDAGPGTYRQLAKLGVELTSIDQIFFTHFHVDHINDLPAILFSLKNLEREIFDQSSVQYISGKLKLAADVEMPEYTPSPLFNPHTLRRRKFFIHGPKGFEENLNKLIETYGEQLKSRDFEIHVREHETGELMIDSIKVSTMEMTHGEMPTVGYRFDDSQGKTLTYSGDTEPCDNLVELANRSQCLLMECSTPDDKPVKGHSTTSQAAEMAKKANVKTLVLTHIFPENDNSGLEIDVAKQFDGHVITARDGMRITI